MTRNELATAVLVDSSPMRAANLLMENLQMVIDALRAKPPEVERSEPEVRLCHDGSLDEIVAKGMNFHLEKMDFNQWWLEVYPAQGVGIAVWLHAKGKITASTERRTYARDASIPQSHSGK